MFVSDWEPGDLITSGSTRDLSSRTSLTKCLLAGIGGTPCAVCKKCLRVKTAI